MKSSRTDQEAQMSSSTNSPLGRQEAVSLAALLVALAGYWSPWLTQPAAALRLSGFDLAEWVTFLPGVRDGSLPLSRLAFLLPLACLALLLGLAAQAGARRRGWRGWLPAAWWGWGLWLLAGVCSLLVLPPYEAFRNREYWPEYQLQFWVACVTVAGVAVSGCVPRQVTGWLRILLAAAGAGCGAWAVLMLRPAANELLNTPWAVGLGWPAMLAGLAGVAAAAAAAAAWPWVVRRKRAA
jgi:hypothetical protein